ncbi:MAG: carbohydrate kinase [Paludibacteraceae bacterium]|nr:carbohydrate kinase [Paludibacteraceae bacterium]
MGSILGIGETIVDILFRNGQPERAVPGGSVFNALVSLSRMGLQTTFVGEAGSDEVGNLVTDFMQENGMSQDYVTRYASLPSPVSLAFLDQHNDAKYVFYKQRPKGLGASRLPRIKAEDALLFGSFYALDDDTRERMVPLLERANEAGAFVYYDPNFRSSHLKERERLLAHVVTNMESASIVRGSDEDFHLLFEGKGPDKRRPFEERMLWIERLYRERLSRYCPYVVCTCGAEGVLLFTPESSKHYEAAAVRTVSTVGAGDNFNAGFLYGLLTGTTYASLSPFPPRERLARLKENEWETCLKWGLRFAADVCSQTGNHVSDDFVREHKKS